jgi:indolepyruvate ferredoxin oxidoreductase alpha subunit
MKKLLMGNEAIALGAIRAGVLVVTGYPGTPSTEILETVAKEASAPGKRASCIYTEWSVNEKTALEVAAGAACSGARSLVTMKQVGLNVASDPLMSLNYLGVLGGLVLAVADDPGPISSQTEQDTRRFGLYAKIPVFDPATPEEAYTMIADAFEWSEKYGRPVILRPTTRVCHSYASIELLPDLPMKPPKGFDKAGNRWVIFPSLTAKNHAVIEEDLVKMGQEFSSYPGNRLESSLFAAGTDALVPPLLGIAAGGVSVAYALEILEDLNSSQDFQLPGVKFFKTGTYPFPSDLALRFLEGLEEVLVLEELDPVIEDELARLCGIHRLRVKIRGKRSGDIPAAGENTLGAMEEKIKTFLSRKIWAKISDIEDKEAPVGDPPASASLSPVQPGARAAVLPAGLSQPEPPPLPVRPPVLCAGCPHRGSFLAVKEGVRKYGKGRKAVFSGDIGCYTLGNALPLDMTDTCLCMGAGITMAQGINRVEHDTINFAFIGDSTFFHTGIQGIVNAVYNRSDIIIAVLDNYTTAMTGNQGHPGTGKTAGGKEGGRISIQSVIAALGIRDIIRVNPFDLKPAEEAVKGILDKQGVRVLIFEGPCIAGQKAAGVCRADPEKCTGCQICVKKLGCPAISPVPGETAVNPGKSKVVVDETLCTGCGLCKDVCAFGAIADAPLNARGKL